MSAAEIFLPPVAQTTPSAIGSATSHTHTQGEGVRERVKRRETETETQTDRQTDRQAGRQTDRQTETEIDTHTDRERVPFHSEMLPVTHCGVEPC